MDQFSAGAGVRVGGYLEGGRDGSEEQGVETFETELGAGSLHAEYGTSMMANLRRHRAERLPPST